MPFQMESAAPFNGVESSVGAPQPLGHEWQDRVTNRKEEMLRMYSRRIPSAGYHGDDDDASSYYPHDEDGGFSDDDESSAISVNSRRITAPPTHQLVHSLDARGAFVEALTFEEKQALIAEEAAHWEELQKNSFARESAARHAMIVEEARSEAQELAKKRSEEEQAKEQELQRLRLERERRLQVRLRAVLHPTSEVFDVESNIVGSLLGKEEPDRESDLREQATVP